MKQANTKAFWFFLGDAGVRIFGFITTVLLARILGAEAFGLITISIAILGFSSWFSDLGLNMLGTRTLSQPKIKRPYKISEFFRIRILLGIGVLFLVSTLIWGTHFESRSTGLIIQLFLLSLIPQSISLEWYFNGSHKYKWITLSRLSQALVYLLLIYLFIQDSDLLRVPVFFLISSLISVSILFSVMPIKQKLKGYWPRYYRVREMIITALPLGLGSLFSQIVIFMPPLVIGFYFGFYEAGLFGVAFKIILLFIFIDRFLIRFLLPDLSNQWEENRVKTQKNLQKSLHWLLFTGTLFAVILSTGSEFFIDILFGEEFTDAVILLKILTLFLPLIFLNSLFSYGMITSGNDTAYLRSGLTGGVASFFIILLITSVGNMVWVVWSVVLAQAIVSISFYIEFRKLIVLDIFSPVVKIFGLAMALMFLPFIGLISYPLSFLLLPVFYLVLIFLSGGLSSGDLLWIKMKLFKEQ
jgi:O-antigen/teichoic acid export membrane protein